MLEMIFPSVGTKGYYGKELEVPRPWNLRFPTWETRLKGIADSQKLESIFSKLSGYYCQELRVPTAWNSWLQA